MKRFCCVLLALFLTLPSAFAEEPEADWTYYESPEGFALWYDAQTFLMEDDRTDGAAVLYPRALYAVSDAPEGAGERYLPKDARSQACLRLEMLPGAVGADWTPPADKTPLEIELDLAQPYFCVTSVIEDAVSGSTVVDELYVLLSEQFFYGYAAYPASDPEGWGEQLWEVLFSLEFPAQPAENADFRLDFFQGGAAGMQFIDVIADDEAEPFVILPLREMRDVALEALEWNDEDFSVAKARPLFLAPRLEAGQNLRVASYFDDILPNLRIRYTDAEGQAQCLYLFQSGRDGSMLLLSEDEL